MAAVSRRRTAGHLQSYARPLEEVVDAENDDEISFDDLWVLEHASLDPVVDQVVEGMPEPHPLHRRRRDEQV